MHLVKNIAPGIIMLIISFIFLSQSITMEKASLTDPAGGNFLPALISVVMIITGITVIIQQIPRGSRKNTDETTDQMETDKTDNDPGFTLKEYRFIITFFIMILIYVILLSFISFFPATFIFLVGSMIYLRDVSWKMNIAVSIGSVIVIYLLFSKLFHIIFP
jgi:hypothetical protein